MAARIGIIGAGAIGSVVGGLLAEAGVDVTLVDQWANSPQRERAELYWGLSDVARRNFADAADRFEGMTSRFPGGRHGHQTELLFAQSLHQSQQFDYVCVGVTDGVREVMRDTGVPVGFGVLTTDDIEQALARAGGSHGNKGAEVARAAIEMACLLRMLPDEPDDAESASDGASA